jgi:hypothetical protein
LSVFHLRFDCVSRLAVAGIFCDPVACDVRLR